MIKLSENKTALKNLDRTIAALETLDYLINKYKEEGKIGPAYCKFDYVDTDRSNVQIDRPIMVETLTKQRKVLVDYLATLGIDANEEDKQ